MHVNHKKTRKKLIVACIASLFLTPIPNKPVAPGLILIPAATTITTAVEVTVTAVNAIGLYKLAKKLWKQRKSWFKSTPVFKTLCSQCCSIENKKRQVVCNNGPRCQCGCGCLGRCGCDCGCGCNNIAPLHGNNSNPIDFSKEIPIFEKNSNHILRIDKGHLPDTPKNRKLLLDLVTDKRNYFGTDMHGNHWFGKTLPDGRQIWVSARNNYIRNGGINDTPECFNTETGLSALKG